jgi:hypothetical protein
MFLYIFVYAYRQANVIRCSQLESGEESQDQIRNEFTSFRQIPVSIWQNLHYRNPAEGSHTSLHSIRVRKIITGIFPKLAVPSFADITVYQSVYRWMD